LGCGKCLAPHVRGLGWDVPSPENFKFSLKMVHFGAFLRAFEQRGYGALLRGGSRRHGGIEGWGRDRDSSMASGGAS